MKKSNIVGKAEKAQKQVKMQLGSIEVLINGNHDLDIPLLHEAKKTPEQQCNLKLNEVCCIFHGHDDISGLMEVI